MAADRLPLRRRRIRHLTWRPVARDLDAAYPVDGIAVGIGPLEGQRLSVSEIHAESGTLQLIAPKGGVSVFYEEGVAVVTAG